MVGTGVAFKDNDGNEGRPHSPLSGEATKDVESTFQADLHFSTTPEDVMLFFHMDSCEQAYVELRRLMFRPVFASKAAARLTARN